MINVIHQFTYKDYIKCIHNIKQKNYLNIKEDEEKYLYTLNNNLENRYKNIIEYLFKDKERICKFINNFSSNYEKLQETNIECIEFTNYRQDIKIVYKNILKNNFYIIIYKQEIQSNLSYNILQECIKIIKKYKNADIKNIMIMPIVIYRNEDIYYKNRKIKQYFEMTTYDKHILELKYNLIKLENIMKKQNMKNTILEELIYINS